MVWLKSFMSTWSDLRFGARMLLREPGFAAVSILTVALGVGANTAIFSIVNGVLLRPMPYAEPDRLVALREVIPAIAQTYPTLPVSARHFTEWRQRTASFERISAAQPGNAALTGVGEPEQIDVARCSADLFDTLGVKAAMGRTFAQGEDQSGRERVAVMADSLWRRRFHADPAILGKSIELDSQAFTVIGVLPVWFSFPSARVLEVGQVSSSKPEVFRPVVFDADELKQLMGSFNYTVVARLKRGVSPERSTAELNAIGTQLVKTSREKMELRAAVIPMRDSIVGKSRRGLLVLLGAVASVLLIVCVNLANLMLARSERQARDSAVRMALGAGRGRLARQVLSGTVLVALIGGVLGVAVAAAGLSSLIHIAPADIPRLDEVRLDAQVLLFALGIATITGLLFGLAPAWRAALADPHDALKAGGRAMSGARGGARLRALLVTVQVGLSVVLLFTAGLFMTSFVRLIHADPGFQAPTVLAADVQIARQKYQTKEQRTRFHEQVLARLGTQPGVVSAAVITALPLTGETWVDTVSAPGDNLPELERPLVNVRFASAGYFRTMGIPLLAGRTFSESDRKRKVAIISERLAHTLWPTGSAAGRQFTANGDNYEAIGVVGDVRAEPHKPTVAIVYRPYWDWAPNRVKLVARAAGDPRSVAGAMRAAVRGVDADVPLPELQTMQEVLAESLAARRFQMLLASAFAGTALLLAALGIYGVVSYSVARRRNEMGVRMALGAQARDLYRMVMQQAMTPVLLGLVAGVAGALAVGRVLASLLYEVRPRDPATISVVSGLLLSVALAACFVPARRAARVAPLDALRYE
jgi:putative ABC transport system permease protein